MFFYLFNGFTEVQSLVPMARICILNITSTVVKYIVNVANKNGPVLCRMFHSRLNLQDKPLQFINMLKMIWSDSIDNVYIRLNGLMNKRNSVVHLGSQEEDLKLLVSNALNLFDQHPELISGGSILEWDAMNRCYNVMKTFHEVYE